MLAAVLATLLAPAVPWQLDAAPSPGLSPREVVELQLESLQRNPQLPGDTGIEAVFRFAAPSNRAVTGPLPRFVQMVKGPGYAPLLGHRSAQLGPLEVNGDQVAMPVFVESGGGERAAYLWVLERQTEAPYAGCWMTVAVMAMDADQARDAIRSNST